jgi:hypothetical protein
VPGRQSVHAAARRKYSCRRFDQPENIHLQRCIGFLDSDGLQSLFRPKRRRRLGENAQRDRHYIRSFSQQEHWGKLRRDIQSDNRNMVQHQSVGWDCPWNDSATQQQCGWLRTRPAYPAAGRPRLCDRRHPAHGDLQSHHKHLVRRAGHHGNSQQRCQSQWHALTLWR